jgi:hypothetical protein
MPTNIGDAELHIATKEALRGVVPVLERRLDRKLTTAEHTDLTHVISGLNVCTADFRAWLSADLQNGRIEEELANIMLDAAAGIGAAIVGRVCDLIHEDHPIAVTATPIAFRVLMFVMKGPGPTTDQLTGTLTRLATLEVDALLTIVLPIGARWLASTDMKRQNKPPLYDGLSWLLETLLKDRQLDQMPEFYHHLEFVHGTQYAKYGELLLKVPIRA